MTWHGIVACMIPHILSLPSRPAYLLWEGNRAIRLASQFPAGFEHGRRMLWRLAEFQMLEVQTSCLNATRPRRSN